MQKYNKAVVAVAGFLTVLGAVLADGSVSVEETGALVVSALTAAGVFRVPNKPAA